MGLLSNLKTLLKTNSSNGPYSTDPNFWHVMLCIINIQDVKSVNDYLAGRRRFSCFSEDAIHPYRLYDTGEDTFYLDQILLNGLGNYMSGCTQHLGYEILPHGSADVHAATKEEALYKAFVGLKRLAKERGVNNVIDMVSEDCANGE